MSTSIAGSSAHPDQGLDGTTGNRRLTATTGMLLLLLLAVEGVTILRIRDLITIHVFVGLLLVLPVLWKMATTGYRFVRYYTGDEAYVRRGAPPLVLRALGPLMILTTLALLATGITLILQGPGHRGPPLLLHKASFFAWVAVTALHVLGHLREAVVESWHDLRPGVGDADGRPRLIRRLTLVAVLLLGVGFATVVYPAAASWTAGQGFHRDGPGIGHRR
ncbi:hypothetical protein [Allobranchiibius huperziae]|uniref:Cytochrome b561 bacterial/Ni-hydrogenase domain-containing protein n=1 Tax=Allobranchiibius huperziae TaxID=1874116 RepID=A0A853DI96_9MICO|nr:hypothetical protein [Allobranchiibius huperziae]NYJ76397.1 hypothetical protein [Allobranchiibius huperziae]